MTRRIITLAIIPTVVVLALAMSLREQRPISGALYLATPLASPVASPSSNIIGFNLPQGLNLTGFDQELNVVPTGPVQLTLTERTIPAGADLGTQTVAGPTLLSVQAGAVTVTNSLGASETLTLRMHRLYPTGASVALQNQGSEPATLYWFTLIPLGDAGVETPAIQDDSFTKTLITGKVTELPPAPARIVITDLSWTPGSALPLHVFTGPVGVLVTTGQLTVVDADGVQGVFAVGDSAILPAGVPNSERNNSAERTVILIAAVFPADAPLIADVPTPSPEPTTTGSMLSTKAPAPPPVTSNQTPTT